jgi:hypothetical protein
MSLLDLDAFGDAPLTREPFEFVVVPGFLKSETVAAVRKDFPDISHAGLFPLSELSFGPSFAALIDEIRGRDVEAAFSDKFGVDLSGHPLMITVRGRCQRKDGRIHTDTGSKIVTVLLYLNEEWEAEGGRLRFLRGPNDLDDAVGEVPPNGGTLIAFRRSDRSYHGHKPYVGVRRYVMFNWMTDAKAMARELARHRMSARLKGFVPWLR